MAVPFIVPSQIRQAIRFLYYHDIMPALFSLQYIQTGKNREAV